MTQLAPTSTPLTGGFLYEELRERVAWNLTVQQLLDAAVSNGEGVLTRSGALSVSTGAFTGRSPRDKFIVRRSPSSEYIDWNSSFNSAMEPESAAILGRKFLAGARSLPRLYGFRGYVGRGSYRVPIALITEFAWHTLMGHHMFVRHSLPDDEWREPEFTLLYLPSVQAEPAVHGTRSETAIVCDLEHHCGFIGGTRYGGEEKKFFFYLMNYLLPARGGFPMHCSANTGPAGDVSLIFGLSGTGKTTLSADPDRRLLGDDEHGWTSEGVFNFEGGCYAKLIRLSREREPLIWNAVNAHGAILENVALKDGEPDFDAGEIENTRGVYPLEAIPNVEPSGMSGHPSTVVFLTFDATGTLPPLSILEPEQALYWFLAGYTAKVAGTERGLGSRPEPTFSACFGAPFLPLAPGRYVELLKAYLEREKPLVVLMNTGSVGGPLGAGGNRPPIDVSRRLLRAAQSGELRQVSRTRHPDYGVWIPDECPGVPHEWLDPRGAWRLDAASYGSAVTELVHSFETGVNEVYRGRIPAEILAAGPTGGR